MKGLKKIFLVNGNQKRAAVSVLKSDKTDFKTKIITRERRTDYTLING